MNRNRTCGDSDPKLTQPRSLSDLRSFLHGYRIKNHWAPLASRASIIIGGIDAGKFSALSHRAAQELANLDPSLSWLPAWKPRVAVAALTKGEG